MEGNGASCASVEDARVQNILSLQAELTDMDRDAWSLDFSVSRWNRLCERQTGEFARIAGEPHLLRFLLNFPEPEVAFSTAFFCGWHAILFDEAEALARTFASSEGKAGEKARKWLELRPQMIAAPRPLSAEPKKTEARAFPPAPPSRSRESALALIDTHLPHRAADLIPLLRRSIGLWPQAVGTDPLASRLGGQPVLGKGRHWPEGEDEPLLFIGQINLVALHAAVGDTRLPKAGVLQVFGHPDDLCGSFPTGLCDVVVRTDLEGGARRAPPEGVQELISCGLAFHEVYELPHPWSKSGQRLRLTKDETSAYGRLIEALTGHPVSSYASGPAPAKLFGWPDLLQGDFPGAEALLMQIGPYSNGAETEGWGPGGTVYVVLNAETVRDGRFEGAEIVVQVT